MSSRYTVLVLIILFIVGCSGLELEQPPGVESGSLTLSVNGVERHLEYRLPEEGASSLVIALHGATDTVSYFEEYSLLTDEVSERKDFGLVYLEGIDQIWNDGRPELNTDVDDVGFIDTVISHYRADGYVRFYLVGMSNGGVMAQRMACENAVAIEGIAVISATQTTWLSDNCSDDVTTVDALFVFGDQDPVFQSDGTIAYNGGTHITMPSTRNYWLTRNECGTMALTKSLDKISDDHTVVDFNDGTSCRAQFRYIDIKNGGHRWADPSAINGSLLLGYASHEISTAKEVLDFFGL